MKIILFCFVAFSLGSAQAAWIYKLNEVVYISGTIEKGDAVKLDEHLSSATKKVVIHSPGGNLEEAIQMARSIRTSGKLIVARKLCGSSCAIILSLAIKVAIDDETIIAFHAGDFEWRLSMMKALESYTPRSDSFRSVFEQKRLEMESASDRLLNLRQSVFEEFNLPYFWHQAVVDLTAMQVIDVDINESKQVIRTSVKPGICDWWIPDIEGLNEAGISVQRYKQLDRSSIAERMKTQVTRIYWGRLHDLHNAKEEPCQPMLKSDQRE